MLLVDAFHRPAYFPPLSRKIFLQLQAAGGASFWKQFPPVFKSWKLRFRNASYDPEAAKQGVAAVSSSVPAW
jgi:hypothetical protein